MILKNKNYINFLFFSIVSTIILILLAFNISDKSWVYYTYLSTITGIICVILVNLKDVRNFHVGIIAVVSYGMVAFHANYLYDYVINIYILIPVQIIGYYMWSKNKSDDYHVKVSPLKHKYLIVGISVISIFILATFFYDSLSVLLKGMPSELPYWVRVLDASTTVFQLLGQYLMIKRYKEQWTVWILFNTISIVMWIYIGNFAVITMFIVYLINSVFAYRNWSSK